MGKTGEVVILLSLLMGVASCMRQTERFEYWDVEKEIPEGVIRVGLTATGGGFLPNGDDVLKGPYNFSVSVELYRIQVSETCKANLNYARLHTTDGQEIAAIGSDSSQFQSARGVVSSWTGFQSKNLDIPYVDYVVEISISLSGECDSSVGQYTLREVLKRHHQKYNAIITQ